MADPVEINIDQKSLISVAGFTDEGGNPVPFTPAAPPTWASSDDALMTVEPQADGMSAYAITGTGVSAEAVLITAKFLDPDGEELIGTVQYNIGAGRVRFVALNAAAPEPQ